MIYYFFIYSRHGQCREAFKLVKNMKESSPVGNPLHSNGNDLPCMVSVANLPMPESFTAQNYNNVKKNPNIFLFFLKFYYFIGFLSPHNPKFLASHLRQHSILVNTCVKRSKNPIEIHLR